MTDEKKPQNPLLVMKQGLLSENSIKAFMDAMPTATGEHAKKTAERFAMMIYTAVANDWKLQQCSLASIVKAASMAASLDLDIDIRGLAYLIPYKNNKGTRQAPQWVMEANFQVGYLGLIDLGYRSGKIKAFSANCIYESEKKNVQITRTDGFCKVVHPFSWEAPTGDIIAVYASAEVDGCKPITAVLRADEVEERRAKSKAPDSFGWTDHKPAMYMKTAIRHLAKFLPKSILKDFSRGAMLDEHQDFVQIQENANAQITGEQGSQEIPIPEEAQFEDKPPVTEPDESVEPTFLEAK